MDEDTKISIFLAVMAVIGFFTSAIGFVYFLFWLLGVDVS